MNVAVAPLTTQRPQLARQSPASVLTKMFASIPEGYQKLPRSLHPISAPMAHLDGFLFTWGTCGAAQQIVVTSHMLHKLLKLPSWLELWVPVRSTMVRAKSGACFPLPTPCRRPAWAPFGHSERVGSLGNQCSANAVSSACKQHRKQ